jgi:hypothetical protein
MAGNPRLALPEDVRQLADRQFGFPQDEQKPKPRRVADGLEHGQKLFHRSLIDEA